MKISRRNVIVMGAGAFGAVSISGLPVFAATTDELIAEFTGGAETGSGALMLEAPEIAENGNTVPIKVSAPGAVAITIYADGNPLPPVATFNFGPMAASREASTRIRLAKSQNVVAVAKMEDGSFQRADVPVKVTIGGCGG